MIKKINRPRKEKKRDKIKEKMIKEINRPKKEKKGIR